LQVDGEAITSGDDLDELLAIGYDYALNLPPKSGRWGAMIETV